MAYERRRHRWMRSTGSGIQLMVEIYQFDSRDSNQRAAIRASRLINWCPAIVCAKRRISGPVLLKVHYHLYGSPGKSRIKVEIGRFQLWDRCIPFLGIGRIGPTSTAPPERSAARWCTKKASILMNARLVNAGNIFKNRLRKGAWRRSRHRVFGLGESLRVNPHRSMSSPHCCIDERHQRAITKSLWHTSLRAVDRSTRYELRPTSRQHICRSVTAAACAQPIQCRTKIKGCLLSLVHNN